MISAGQIGSANTALENGIAHQHLFAVVMNEDHMARRVTWHKSYFYVQIAQF